MPFTKFNNKTGKLQVSTNHRYLVFSDGTPFFYLGDTAWELFHRLSLEEAKQYLLNRVEKGFTVIQAVVLAELDGLTAANFYGDLPLIDCDLTTPNEAYFRHVDNIIHFAEEIGLFIGMLPTWGSNWKKEEKKEAVFTKETAQIFGRFLGERYRNNAIIWILGGDRFVENDEEFAIIESMALGLKEGDAGSHLITFHPRGPGCSSETLHQAKWLDFNMCQSSHGAHDNDIGIFIENDYNLDPPKPTLDGEPHYETMPVGFYYKDTSRYDRFDDYDARQAAYWALLSGACGHTYGNNNIWQMWSTKFEPVLWANKPWIDSLDTPGAYQMGNIRQLFESFAFQDFIPAQEMIVDGCTNGGGKIRASRSSKGAFAFIYSPRGEPFTINKKGFNSKNIKEFWYDPRYGCKYHFHTTANAAFQTYAPPTSGRGNDWLLILESE